MIQNHENFFLLNFSNIDFKNKAIFCKLIDTCVLFLQLKKVRKVPKGWSDYQAAWIPDNDAEFLEDASEDNSDSSEDEFMDAASEEHSNKSGENEFNEFASVTESEVAVNDERYDRDMDIEAEKQALLKLKEAKNDQQFPDEVDTPMDQLASERFQRYRGLESFRY